MYYGANEAVFSVAAIDCCRCLCNEFYIAQLLEYGNESQISLDATFFLLVMQGSNSSSVISIVRGGIVIPSKVVQCSFLQEN